MPIPTPYAGRYIYHFSHFDNLSSLLKTGFLANNHPSFAKAGCRSIAAAGIQERRSTMAVPCGPRGCVHDYVPLYFGSRSPMLLGVIYAKNIDQFDILYFEFPISLLDSPNTVFTDASANTILPPNFYHDPADLDKLNWREIDSLKWTSATDQLRHQRMAEVLVHQKLPLKAASRCVVWSDETKRRVEATVAAANVPFPSIEFESSERRHWFTAFTTDGGSAVKGPKEIALWYDHACSEIKTGTNRSSSAAPFATPKRLLEGLRGSFGCIPQTAELVGLKSANGIHKKTVDDHTKEVVTRLLALAEYAALASKLQPLVELAAYLHDIGKGPRARWDVNGGVQQVDPNHPVGAMPMMVEILTKQVGEVKEKTARTLVKLVCYHDLVGDVLGRNRDEQQIVDVSDDEEDLQLLFALGRADATSLNETWWDEVEATKLYKRCLSKILAKRGVSRP